MIGIVTKIGSKDNSIHKSDSTNSLTTIIVQICSLTTVIIGSLQNALAQGLAHCPPGERRAVQHRYEQGRCRIAEGLG